MMNRSVGPACRSHRSVMSHGEPNRNGAAWPIPGRCWGARGIVRMVTSHADGRALDDLLRRPHPGLEPALHPPRPRRRVLAREVDPPLDPPPDRERPPPPRQRVGPRTLGPRVLAPAVVEERQL